MEIRKKICQAFCDSLTIREVPAGLAIGTGFVGADGDCLGLYLVGPASDGSYVIQDDGGTILCLEAKGAGLDNKTRLEALSEIKDIYSVSYDELSGDFKVFVSDEQGVPGAILNFISFLHRVQDLAFMAVERAASTFKEDALRQLRMIVGDQAKIVENFIVDQRLGDFPADIGVVSDSHPPVAMYWGTSDAKVLEALLLQAYAMKYQVNCTVGTMLETSRAVPDKLRIRASNLLDFVAFYREGGEEACLRVAREALGKDFSSLRH